VIVLYKDVLISRLDSIIREQGKAGLLPCWLIILILLDPVRMNLTSK